MQANVDWPNGMEGGRVLGKSAVRDYWKRQFEVLDPNVEPKNFTREADGRIAIDVHQVVHDKSGKLVVDQMIQHVYEFRRWADSEHGDSGRGSEFEEPLPLRTRRFTKENTNRASDASLASWSLGIGVNSLLREIYGAHCFLREVSERDAGAG